MLGEQATDHQLCFEAYSVWARPTQRSSSLLFNLQHELLGGTHTYNCPRRSTETNVWIAYELVYGGHVGHLPYCCPSLAISDTNLSIALATNIKNSPFKVFFKETLCVRLCTGGSIHCYVHCSSVC